MHVLRKRRVAPQQEVEEEIEEIEEVEDETEEDADAVAETMDDMDRIEAKYRERATSPLRAIRAFCVICMGCQPRMVAKCTAVKCPNYLFRFGKNPFQKHTKKSKE